MTTREIEKNKLREGVPAPSISFILHYKVLYFAFTCDPEWYNEDQIWNELCQYHDEHFQQNIVPLFLMALHIQIGISVPITKGVRNIDSLHYGGFQL